MVWKTGIVLTAGILFGTVFPAFGLTTIVPAGETASGGDVNTIITQEVYGTADNFTVSGIQKVMAGGVTHNSTVYNQQDVLSGGRAYDTYVYTSAMQNISGTAYDSTVVSRGNINVNSGGQLAGAAINGGTLRVLSGGTVEDAVVKSGYEYVYGTDKNSRIFGGTQEVLSGGGAIGTQINGGKQIVDAGGTAENTVVASDGHQQIYGSLSNGTVAKDGMLDILSGGMAKNLQLTGGDIYLAAGATNDSAIVSSGTFDVYGTDSHSVLNGGLQNIWSGGAANNTTVNAGGVQRVYSGGTANNTTVNKNGLLALYSGGILGGQTTVNNGILSVFGNNNIDSLTMDNSYVSLPKVTSDYTVLSVGELNGSGVFGISSNLAAGNADKINIQSGSGNFGLIIYDYSADDILPQRFDIVNEAAAAADDFYLVGGAADVGALRYVLQHDGENWSLVRTSNVTDSAVLAKNTYASLASLFYAHLTPIYNRLRVLRGTDERQNDFWIKGFGRQIKFDYDDESRSEIEVYGTEAGYDREIWAGRGQKMLLGFYSGISSSQQEYDRRGSGNGDTQSLGIYSSWRTVGRWFADVVATYFYHRQKINSYTPAGTTVAGKYSTDAWQVSLLAGRRLMLPNGWFAEPAVEVNYMHIDGADYRTNFDTPVEAAGLDYAGIGAGVVLGKNWDFDDDGEMSVYGKLGLKHDWSGQAEVEVAGYGFKEKMDATRFEIGGGTSISLNKDSLLYLDAATSFGDGVSIPWEISGGIQIRF